MESNGKISDSLLDTAACDVLGMNSPAESAAYEQELTLSGDEARRSDRDLRETVARLAAASPHMSPPAALRGRILQATAPTSFRMEDYRKAMTDDSRFYKWGFYAAALFLMAAAWFNLSTRSRLNAEVANLTRQTQERNVALTAFVDPNRMPITLVDDKGKPFARALADVKTHKALMIVSQELLDQGKAPQLVLPQDGKNVAFETTIISAPAALLKFDVPDAKITSLLNFKSFSPDLEPSHVPHIAGQH